MRTETSIGLPTLFNLGKYGERSEVERLRWQAGGTDLSEGRQEMSGAEEIPASVDGQNPRPHDNPARGLSEPREHGHL
ncbi:hypothetical protein ACIQFZ_25770 [Streptomyces sp. NPDC093064]|uniref:hypothetical protein n=1 Tax=Streptomyces sp. NPDC093064 TaxID=3366020 RepID=UPI0037F390D8